jgi:hypothetical protein
MKLADGLAGHTLLFLIVGALLSVVFLYGMWRILDLASRTYGLSATDNSSDTPNWLLAVGSGLLLAGSALLIASFGWAPAFLPIGPVLSLLGPVVIIVSFAYDIGRYRAQLAEAARQRPTESA